MVYKNPKLVIIRWHDAQSTDDWDHIGEPSKMPVIQSVGWLVAENKDALSLVPNVDITAKWETGSCRMDIPRGTIVGMCNQGPIGVFTKPKSFSVRKRLAFANGEAKV